MLGYKPEGMEMWDAWCIEHDEKLHLIHLQFLSANSVRSKEEANSLGYAISANLMDWEEMPVALKPGASGGLDDLQAWTGCVYKHEDIFYLYYTMRSSLNNAKEQHIGLAISKDLFTWQRYAGNPVISPDSKWYVHKDQPLPNGVVDCRDLVIVDNPNGKGWYGFYAGRTPSSKLTDGSVIALVYSEDLISWRHLPPAFEPKKYACIEVPDVFYLDGRWYMTCLTGNGYGNRGIFIDRHVTNGTIYAVADSIEGPYYEFPDDHLLIAGDVLTGYSCRSFMFQGKRYAFYTERGTNTLSPPMELGTTEEGYLRLKYCDRTSLWRRGTIIETGQMPPISGLPYCHQIWRLPGGTWSIDSGVYKGDAIDGGWQVADLGIGSANIEIEATIEIMSGKAGGLVWRGNSPHIDCSDNLIIMLDADEKIVQATYAPFFPHSWTRDWEITNGKTYHLRIVVRQPRVEVYIDDHLALQFGGTFAESVLPSIGLFVDRAAVKIANLSAYRLS